LLCLLCIGASSRQQRCKKHNNSTQTATYPPA
jgi:hypothetical protein